MTCTTKKYINGKWITIRDSFAVYNSFEDSVKAGDSWCRIAAQLLGKEGRAGELAAFNGRKITDTIHPGDVLKIMNNQ